jgi:hypothetical protein
MSRKSIGVGLVWLCAGLAHAQSTTSTILGHVRAETQAALPGAEVTARHVESGLVRSTTADDTGHFTLAALPVGLYEVQATLDRFRPLARPGIRLVVGEPVVLNLTLVLGGAEDEVTVTQEVSAVRTRSGELSYLVSAETIRDLPLNGRNYTDLAFLQPGVIAFPYREGGSVVAHGLAASVNGQDPRSNVYLLDGTLMNDFTNSPAGSAAGTTLGTETVREFRVEANAYGAEFGRSPGGQINVITKSGTNAFHGSAYEFHRNDALDARNYYDPVEKPDFRRNQFGFTLGGPVRRDRTFFFVGYEGLRESLGRTISTVVPNEAARSGVLPAPGGGTITARSWAEASPPTASRSPRRSTRTTSRSGSTRTWAGTTSCSFGTRTTGPSSTCPPISPSSRARSCRGTSSRPRSTGGCSPPAPWGRSGSGTRARGSARRSRPTRPSPSRRSCPGGSRSARSTSGAFRGSGRRCPPTCPSGRTSSPSTATFSTPAGGTR